MSMIFLLILFFFTLIPPIEQPIEHLQKCILYQVRNILGKYELKKREYIRSLTFCTIFEQED